MRLLLDTSAYSEMRRGHPEVVGLVRRASRILLSPIVLGELLFGFRLGRRYEQNVEELEAFLESPFVEVVPTTAVTADRFARVAASLRRKGRPLPTNDIWIAAQALETGADLVTFDRHFEDVEGVVARVFPTA